MGRSGIAVAVTGVCATATVFCAIALVIVAVDPTGADSWLYGKEYTTQDLVISVTIGTFAILFAILTAGGWIAWVLSEEAHTSRLLIALKEEEGA